MYSAAYALEGRPGESELEDVQPEELPRSISTIPARNWGQTRQAPAYPVTALEQNGCDYAL